MSGGPADLRATLIGGSPRRRATRKCRSACPGSASPGGELPGDRDGALCFGGGSGIHGQDPLCFGGRRLALGHPLLMPRPCSAGQARVPRPRPQATVSNASATMAAIAVCRVRRCWRTSSPTRSSLARPGSSPPGRQRRPEPWADCWRYGPRLAQRRSTQSGSARNAPLSSAGRALVRSQSNSPAPHPTRACLREHDEHRLGDRCVAPPPASAAPSARPASGEARNKK